MTQLKRKSLIWIVFDFFGTIILFAGMLKYLNVEVPFISHMLSDFSASLLIAVGAIIMVLSTLLFVAQLIKSKQLPDQSNSNSAIERTKR